MYAKSGNQLVQITWRARCHRMNLSCRIKRLSPIPPRICSHVAQVFMTPCQVVPVLELGQKCSRRLSSTRLSLEINCDF